MDALTARQQQILDFIRQFAAGEGFPPTRAEIARALGFRSANAAEDHLRALARKGAIELLAGASRGIRVLADANARTGSAAGGERSAGLLLPVVGRVAAGRPMLAEEHVEMHSRLDRQLFRPRAHYLLRVRGESMREAGILHDDLLAVHRTAEAGNGQVVVARVDDEVTVKRFRRRGHVVRLLPENADFEPIVVDLRRQQLVIEGIGVGVLRAGRAL